MSVVVMPAEWACDEGDYDVSGRIIDYRLAHPGETFELFDGKLISDALWARFCEARQELNSALAAIDKEGTDPPEVLARRAESERQEAERRRTQIGMSLAHDYARAVARLLPPLKGNIPEDE